MATSDECDTCHVVDNINLTWLITDQACIGIPVLAGTLNQTAPLNFQAYPDVVVTFSTKEFHYDLDANCIPVFVELTNYGTDPVVLDSTQAAALSDLTTAYYGPFLKIPLAHESGLPVQPGLFLEPGASTYFSTIFSRERFELYSNPPLGGGLVRYERNIEGPSTSTGILGRHQFTISFDVDFGPLPTSRVYDPGAGTSFVGGELLVAFHDGVTLEEAESVVRRLNCHIKSVNLFDSIGWIRVYIPFDRTTSEMESAFRREPEVRLTEKDTIISIDPISGGGGGFTIQPVF